MYTLYNIQYDILYIIYNIQYTVSLYKNTA